MLGMEQLILQELEKSFRSQGLNVNASLFGNEIIVTIGPDELRKAILSSIPEPFRSMVFIECGSIVVRIRLSFGLPLGGATK
jgi:hypothetical protein